MQLKAFKYSIKSPSSFIQKAYIFCFMYNQLIGDYFMYKLFSFSYNVIVKFFFMILYNTSWARLNQMVLTTLSSMSSYSWTNCFFNALCRPFCTNKSFTLNCHSPKLFFPSNFSTSNFTFEIFPDIDELLSIFL